MVVVEEGCRTVEKEQNQQMAADEEGLVGKTASGMVVVPQGCSLMMVMAVEGTVAAEAVADKVVDAAFGFEEKLGKEAGLVELVGND